MNEAFTEKQKSLFGKANDGDRKAVRTIMDYGLFEAWLDWNVALYIRFNAMSFASDWKRRIDPQASFDSTVEEYVSLAQQSCLADYRADLEACLMDILFNEPRCEKRTTKS